MIETAPVSPSEGRSSRIGDSVLRTEDDRLLRGRGRFLDDLELGPKTLHVVFVRSQHAHADITAVDTQAARAEGGAVAILTAADIAGRIKPIEADYQAPGFKVTARPVLTDGRARFVGDTVAMVLAPDPYQALDAAELVEVSYDSLPAVTDTHAAVADDAPLVHESAETNVLFSANFSSPDFEAAHAAAPLKMNVCFKASRMAAVPMEPRGCAAELDAGTGVLTVWSSTQVPHMLMTCLREHLGLRESDIRVIAPDIGGGFGMKAAVYPEELLVAHAALRFRVPVKWVQDRYDDLLSSAQARDHEYTVEAGFDQDGRLISILADVLVNVGAYAMLPFGSSLEANGAPRNLPGPYTLRHFRYRTQAVATNTCPTGAYRGVSAPLAFFSMEGVMDRIARRLDLDPAEVRRRNLVQAFPYKNVLGLEYEEGCFVPALDRALVLADYDRLRAELKASRGSVAGRLRGVGLAVITEQTGMGSSRYKARGLLRVPGFEGASVKIEPDGTATAAISQSAQGQGHATAFAQIASDRLGIPLGDIRIVEGDTAATPFGTGTFASRGIIIAGGAVQRAAEEIAGKLRRMASHLLECAETDIELLDGQARIVGTERAVTVRELAAIAYGGDPRSLPPGESFGLQSLVFNDTPSARVASAVHVATVEVDCRTGCVSVLDYVVVHDCGRMVNPALVDGQIQGAVVQGLGEVLMEAVRHDASGQPLSVSFMDYQLPRCVDLSAMRIEALHSERGAEIFKGAGESGTIGAVPALANAISDALSPLGVEVDSLPLSAEAIHEHIMRAQSAMSSEYAAPAERAEVSLEMAR